MTKSGNGLSHDSVMGDEGLETTCASHRSANSPSKRRTEVDEIQRLLLLLLLPVVVVLFGCVFVLVLVLVFVFVFVLFLLQR